MDRVRAVVRAEVELEFKRISNSSSNGVQTEIVFRPDEPGFVVRTEFGLAARPFGQRPANRGLGRKLKKPLRRELSFRRMLHFRSIALLQTATAFGLGSERAGARGTRT